MATSSNLPNFCWRTISWIIHFGDEDIDFRHNRNLLSERVEMSRISYRFSLSARLSELLDRSLPPRLEFILVETGPFQEGSCRGGERTDRHIVVVFGKIRMEGGGYQPKYVQ